MRVKQERFQFSDVSAISRLSINGKEFWLGTRQGAFTLEDTDRRLEEGGEKLPGITAIPRGVYLVTLEWSNRFQCVTPLFHNVQDFTHVRCHWGNTPADTEGCPLIGDAYADDWVNNSRATFAKLMKILEAAVENGERIEWEVV